MVKNRAIIIPDANVKGERKTKVMKTMLGTQIALSMSPHVKKAYKIEGETNFDNPNQFYNAVTKSVNGKMPWEIESVVENFSKYYEYDATRLIIT